MSCLDQFKLRLSGPIYTTHVFHFIIACSLHACVSLEQTSTYCEDIASDLEVMSARDMPVGSGVAGALDEDVPDAEMLFGSGGVAGSQGPGLGQSDVDEGDFRVDSGGGLDTPVGVDGEVAEAECPGVSFQQDSLLNDQSADTTVEDEACRVELTSHGCFLLG